MLLIIPILFSLLQLAVAFMLVVFSVHGPSSLPAFTLPWLIIIQILLWAGFTFLGKSNNKLAPVYLIFLGLITISSAPLLFFAAEKYDVWRWNNIITNTKIYDVRDELLLTDEGLPFGIRFSFKAEFPYTDYNYITPVLRPQSDQSGGFIGPNDMRILRYTTTPALKRDYYFKKGVTYDIAFELIPGYLLPKRYHDGSTDDAVHKEFCLQYPIENVQAMTRDKFEKLITSDNPDHYTVMLHGSGYGDIYSGKKPEFTYNRYNPADFYSTYKALNLDECQLQ